MCIRDSDRGVRVVRGRGRLTGPGTVAVEPEGEAPYDVSPDMILLATGAAPRVMDTAQPDGDRILTWQQVWSLQEVPDHPVSYTHLDVYKRQASKTARTTSPPTPCIEVCTTDTSRGASAWIKAATAATYASRTSSPSTCQPSCGIGTSAVPRTASMCRRISTSAGGTI